MIRRLRSEDGVALTVAIFTLAVIALFSALVATTAGHLSNTSNESRDAKRAIAVANTGVATALHHLNTMGAVGNLECLTNDIFVDPYAQATPQEGISAAGGAQVHVQQGQCPGASGRAGNDGTWRYYITLLNNGQHCDNQYTTQAQVNDLLAFNSGGISVLRRCIVSYGVVNGVQRRVQQEVYSDFRLFHGLIGLDAVTVDNGADLGASHVGSNGSVFMESGTLFNGQVEVADLSKADIQATGVFGVTERHDPWIADPAEVESDEFQDTAGITCAPLCSPWVGGEPATRRVTVPALTTVTFQAGDYRLCELTLDGGTVEVVGTVNLWIDDDCAGDGLVLNRGGLLNTVGGAVPSSLRIYVEGNRDVNIGGGLATTANLTLYAPLSKVTVGGGSVAPLVNGSVTAREILVTNSASFVADPLLDITAPFEQIAGHWHPGDWSECQAYPPDPNDHLSGCND